MQKEHFEILLENIDSKFNLVLEGYSVLAKQITDTRDELKEDITLLDVKITGLSKRVDAVETNLNNKIDAVETNLNNKIDAVEAKLISKIDAVEAKLISKIDAVASDVTAHRMDTEAHRSLYAVREG